VALLSDGRALLASFTSQLFRPDNSTPRLVVPAAVDLGHTLPDVAIPYTVSIENSGGATLEGIVTFEGALSGIIVSGSRFTVPPGQSAALVLQFRTSAVGTSTGTLDFRSNGNWQRVPVTVESGVQLSGRLSDAAGAGIGPSTVVLGGASSATTVTDAVGRYRFLVEPNHDYTVTPSNALLAWSPTTRSVHVGTQNVGDQDFTGEVVDPIALFVVGLYEHILGRRPSIGEVGGRTSILHGACDPTGFRMSVDVFFFQPPEFEARPLTLAALVTALYRGLLGREPEPAGFAGWVSVFRETRLAIATHGFIPSAEFQRVLPSPMNRSAVTVLVPRLYAELLGRVPSAPELTSWVDYVTTTSDVEGMAAGFLASGEFEARSLTFQGYIALLYRAFLGREPDPTGLSSANGWTSILWGRLRDVVDGAFLPSAEFQERIRRLCAS
jgi:hypothetical protein